MSTKSKILTTNEKVEALERRLGSKDKVAIAVEITRPTLRKYYNNPSKLWPKLIAYSIDRAYSVEFETSKSEEEMTAAEFWQYYTRDMQDGEKVSFSAFAEAYHDHKLKFLSKNGNAAEFENK